MTDVKFQEAVLGDTRWTVRLEAVRALERLKDSSSVPALLPMLTDVSERVRKAAVKALVSLEWSPASVREEVLLKMTQGEPRDFAELGASAVPVLAPIAADRSADRAWRLLAMDCLGWTQAPSALSVLAGQLTDASFAWKAAAVLEEAGWRPADDTVEIHYLVAKKDYHGLRERWESVGPLLLGDIEAQDADRRALAFEALVGIGREETVPAIIVAFEGHPVSKDTAEILLNCGQEALQKAAQKWAGDNGYEIIGQPWRGVRWGKRR